MKTPICDFVKKYAESNAHRLHMPGHKGTEFFGFEKFDITEFNGADVLYSPQGIIKESQANASAIFSTQKTLYSCEGSSLSVRAMLYLALLYGKGKRKTILAARNAHKVFMSAAALLDFEIEWIYPEKNTGIMSCRITPEQLNELLSQTEEKPVAFYVTSPDYLGFVADIKGFAQVCDKHNVLLLCDNAHGAYLNFTEKNEHPISLGAHLCCDSAHKTLPVLTGGGYLHIGKNAPQCISDNAERAMSLFATTSPSYIIMQSLDYVNPYLDKCYKKELAECIEKTEALKRTLFKQGYEIIGDEKTKITIATKSYGYKGTEVANYLEKNNIYCEFYDPDYVVLMVTPQTNENTFIALEKALLSLPKKETLTETMPTLTKAKQVISPREAMLCAVEEIATKDAVGRISATENVACPPAIPIVVCGEEINEGHLMLFEYYGIDKITVTKK